MIVIGCDPGTKYIGFAIFNDKKLVDFGKLDASFDSVNNFFSENIVVKTDDFVFAVEHQYFSKNVNTLIKLVEVRTFLTTLAQIYLAPQIFVLPPQEWQTKYLGISAKQDRQSRKNTALFVASSVAGQKISDIDIADAICIADYARKTLIFNAERGFR